jgi:Ankyrin repeats (3 copies)
LLEAVQAGDLETVKTLMIDQVGIAMIDEPIGGDLFDETPLFIASGSGHVEIIKFLIELGASINKPATDGSTPLFIAAQMGWLECLAVAHRWISWGRLMEQHHCLWQHKKDIWIL